MDKLFFIAVLGALVVAILLGSGKDESPPSWRNICVKSHIDMIPYTVMINNMPNIQYMYIDSCDQYERQCVTGKDYKGPIKDCSNG